MTEKAFIFIREICFQNVGFYDLIRIAQQKNEFTIA
jgi:hypothetical protein